jgi:hypothetical protein
VHQKSATPANRGAGSFPNPTSFCNFSIADVVPSVLGKTVKTSAAPKYQGSKRCPKKITLQIQM